MLLFYFYIEFGMFAKNKWPLLTSVFEFEPSKSYILTPLTSSQLGLNCRDKTCSDQEDVLSAHITMREGPPFWNFPVSVTSILNLYKNWYTEHLPYRNQDLKGCSPSTATAERLNCTQVSTLLPGLDKYKVGVQCIHIRIGISLVWGKRNRKLSKQKGWH